VLAAREDASAAFRLLLEDLGHYGVARKDRDDQGMTVYLEEFSAVSDGARAAIDLAERLRDAGVGVVFVVQFYEGLGEEHQAARLLGSSAAVIVHRMPQPERRLAGAGQVRTPEQTMQLDQWGARRPSIAADDPAAPRTRRRREVLPRCRWKDQAPERGNLMEFLPSDVDKHTDDLIKQAAEREQSGDYPRAQDALQEIASTSTDGSLVGFANFNIGRLWAVQGDPKEAERSYRLAAEHHPSLRPQVSLELGRIAEAGNRSEEAADLYRAAIESGTGEVAREAENALKAMFRARAAQPTQKPGPEPQPAPATKRAPQPQRASEPRRAPEPQPDPAPHPDPEPQPPEPQVTTVPPEETTGRIEAPEGQFPPDEPFLVGRDDSVERLVAALRRAGTAAGEAAMVVVSGAAGKGAVVRRAAHLVPELFPDGRYWVTVSDDDPGKALEAALSALGQTPPAELEDQRAMYRSVTESRRILVVLEGPSTEQAEACRLQAAGSALVAIRSSLTVEGAEVIELAELDRSARFEILRHGGAAAAAAVDQDPAAIDRILAIDDFPTDPAGLTMLAQVLAGGVPAADLANFLEAELRDLDELDDENADPAVSALVESLTPEERRIFSFLVLLPEDRTFTAERFADALEVPVAQVDSLLSRLARAGSVERPARGRYRTRRATRIAAIELFDPPETQLEIIGRLWLARLQPGIVRPIRVAQRRRELASLYADVAEGGDDLLDVKRDVDALSYVLAAKDLSPPLSIGLFGDWGTGKTFFMDLMRRRIRKLAADSSTAGPGHTQFCSDVRQIVFNAWHYIDANLWASLVTHILTELARPDDATNLTDRAKQEHQALLEELATSRALQDEAQAKIESVKRQGEKLSKSLDEVRNQRWGLMEKLQSAPLALAELQSKKHPTEAEAKLRERAEELQQSLEHSQTIDIAGLKGVASDLQGLGGRLRQLSRLLRHQGRLLWGRVFLAAVVVAVVGAVLWYAGGGQGEVAGRIAAVVGALAAAADYLVVLRGPVGKVRRAVGTAADFLTFVDELEPARKRELDRQIEALKAEEEQLQRGLDQAVDREQDAQRQLDDIREGRRLYRYIEERARSGEYQKYLGLVALVRKDFETLTLLMEQSRLPAEAAGDRSPAAPGPAAATAAGVVGPHSGKRLPRIERVILYIDDLDRCPADRVVEVLEAVHLLLAFKLFVVVVGVDSRWLLRSLERHYADQLSDRGGGVGPNDEEAYWASTPQNYLEKIFQVPFSIRPMGQKAYENLITELSRHSTAGGSAGTPPAPSAGPAPAAAGTDQPRPEAAASTARPTAEATPPDAARRRARTPGDQPATSRGGAATRTAAPSQPSDHPALADEQSELKPDALLMQPAEVEYMKRLAKLVATPRAAKRLLNTYRLLRASLTDAEHARFVPSPEGADHYMIVLVLLGVVVGFPNQAWPMFRSLVESERSDWWSFWGDLRDAHGDEGPDPAAGAPAAGLADAHLRREEPGELPSAARPDGPPSAAPRPFAVGGLDLDEQVEQVGATRRLPAALPEPVTARQQAERRDQAERADAQWERLFDVFDHLDAGDLPTSIDAFKYWAWKVSRYSFQTGRIAGLAALDAELP
jgi:TolA-binding protein